MHEDMALSIKSREFDSNRGIKVFILDNGYIQIKVTNLGCRILDILMPDKNGNKKDILLGLDNLNDYYKDTAYFGAVLGRVGSRIKDARFTLNEVEYKLAANNAGNHLHGGINGFDKKVFKVDELEQGLRFTYTSADGEEGYPGCLTLRVEYIVKNNSLIILYQAESDKDTIVNFTNHMYFNLGNNSEYIGKHLLKINANKVLCVDKDCMVTGDILEVVDTPFDFRNEKAVEDCLNKNHDQLVNAKGIDHPYIISNEEAAVMYDMEEIGNKEIPYQITLSDSESKRMLRIYTTAPAVQVYTGNYLEGGCIGKGGKAYKDWSGIALETECFPNAINTENKDQVILKAGDIFKSQSVYSFFVMKE